MEKLESFDEFSGEAVPGVQAYYLMPAPQARRELKEVGWTKKLELAKVARRCGQEFDCPTWLHKTRSLPKVQFKQEVEGN